MFTTDKLLEKWNPVLDVDGDLKDRYKRGVTATVLENTEKALAEERGHGQFQLNEEMNIQMIMPVLALLILLIEKRFSTIIQLHIYLKKDRFYLGNQHSL